MPKNAYFFDIDGTMYFTKFHEVSDRLIDDLYRLKEQGHDLYVISSRTLHQTRHLPKRLREFPFKKWILQAGALVLDENKQPVSETFIDPEACAWIDQFCSDHDLLWSYSTPETDWFDTEPGSRNRWNVTRLYLGASETRPYDHQQKLLNAIIWTPDEDIQRQITEELKNVSMVVYPSKVIEVRSSRVSKEAVIEEAKQDPQYERVICFGDGHNDVHMMEEADFGIAMGNACQATKENADLIIDPVWMDGIANYLEKEELK